MTRRELVTVGRPTKILVEWVTWCQVSHTLNVCYLSWLLSTILLQAPWLSDSIFTLYLRRLLLIYSLIPLLKIMKSLHPKCPPIDPTFMAVYQVCFHFSSLILFKVNIISLPLNFVLYYFVCLCMCLFLLFFLSYFFFKLIRSYH